MSNNKTTPEALGSFISDKSIKLFEDLQIYSHREIEARYEIALENYTKAIQIESRTLGEIVVNQIIPVCIEYQNRLIQNIKGLKDVGVSASIQTDMLKKIAEGIEKLNKLSDEMTAFRIKANEMKASKKQADLYCEKVKPLMEQIRESVDDLEAIIDNEIWPLPKYREMLFTKL